MSVPDAEFSQIAKLIATYSFNCPRGSTLHPAGFGCIGKGKVWDSFKTYDATTERDVLGNPTCP